MVADQKEPVENKAAMAVSAAEGDVRAADQQSC